MNIHIFWYELIFSLLRVHDIFRVEVDLRDSKMKNFVDSWDIILPMNSLDYLFIIFDVMILHSSLIDFDIRKLDDYNVYVRIQY